MNFLKTIFIALFPALLLCSPANAGGLIRDAEIESTLRSYAEPLLKTAGLKSSAVNLYIVNDDSLNAFVAGGQNLFLHTGLIMATKTPDMLLGVIAHETGHIAGGHLAAGGEKFKDAQIGTIMAMVLGAAAAVTTGKMEAGAAVLSGTTNSVNRNILAFTRANENAADQAALNYLEKLGISSEGMFDMFSLLKKQEKRRFGSPDPYLLTHPLSSERMEFVRNHVEKSKISRTNYNKEYEEKHARMLAKLSAFIKAPEQTLKQYKASDKSTASQIARAIALFKQAKMKESLLIMENLTAQLPDDAFLYDLKGQILFESAQIEDALVAYKKAAALLPNNALIISDLAKVELARSTAEDIKSAIKNLERSITIDKNNSYAWRLLATAYGKNNNQPMASLALAEEALLIGDAKTAIIQSEKAIATLIINSPAHRRADDVKQRAINMEKEQKEK